ncbi:MAG: helix-turn-helix transcriptional regulator [Chloroflexi bacterium]|nr:helix-turn-helix transcriptional regulator [Chloroflexota bacterium]
MIRVRELRDAKGLTLPDLERVTGIDRQTIWRYENDRMVPSVERAYLLAEALGVSLNELYVHDPEAIQPSEARGNDNEAGAAFHSSGAGLARNGA